MAVVVVVIVVYCNGYIIIVLKVKIKPLMLGSL